MTIIISIFTGLIGVMLGGYFANNRLLFEKKIEIYSSFIDALCNAAASTANNSITEDIQQKVFAQTTKMQLISSDSDISLLIDKLYKCPHEQLEIRDKLIVLMRNDLLSSPIAKWFRKKC
tara:strand:- start:72 stop:431 length:360 start_codon:yes stop_codon:yes gene_type:complete